MLAGPHGRTIPASPLFPLNLATNRCTATPPYRCTTIPLYRHNTVPQVYQQLAGGMFGTLERMAAADSKHGVCVDGWGGTSHSLVTCPAWPQVMSTLLLDGHTDTGHGEQAWGGRSHFPFRLFQQGLSAAKYIGAPFSLPPLPMQVSGCAWRTTRIWRRVCVR